MSPLSESAAAAEAPATEPAAASAAPAPHSAPVAPDRWAAWDRFLEGRPDAGFMQSSWWADFRTTVGYGHFGVILKDGGGIVGGAMVQKLRHRSGSIFYYIQEGPVLPAEESRAEEILAATMAAIDERRKSEAGPVSHVRIEPRWESPPARLPGFEPIPRRDRYVEPRNTLCIDLRPSIEEILARMAPKGRYNVSVAQRHGVTVVEDTSRDGLSDFQGIYGDTAARQGFRRKPPAYFQDLLPLAAPEGRARLFFAEHRGVRLAAALVVQFGPRATYFYGGSLADRREVMAPYLLHFEILRRAKEAGREWYDLWGVAPPGDPSHPWAGISTFKRRFGGREVRLVPTLDYVYDRAAYMRYAAT